MRGKKIKRREPPQEVVTGFGSRPVLHFRRNNLRRSDRIGNVASGATKAVHHASSEASEHNIGRKALTDCKAPLKLNCHG
jgi:hypothetical protein